MNTIEKAIYNRTELLVGDDVMTALAKTRVIISASEEWEAGVRKDW